MANDDHDRMKLLSSSHCTILE